MSPVEPFVLPEAGHTRMRAAGMSETTIRESCKAINRALLAPSPHVEAVLRAVGVPADASVEQTLAQLAATVGGDNRKDLFARVFGADGILVAYRYVEEIPVRSPVTAAEYPAIIAQVQRDVAEQEAAKKAEIEAGVAEHRAEAGQLLDAAALTGEQRTILATWLRYLEHHRVLDSCCGTAGQAADILYPGDPNE